jgi:hypothetical protein
MQPIRSLLGATLVAAALLGAGCYATVSGEAYGPDLVTVSPGVQVIADYDEPIFYTDGFYWRYYGGVWYRSTVYTGGWVYAQPPVAVLRIDRPYGYAHYRPAGYVGRPRPAGGWRGNPQPAPAGAWRGNPPPAGGGWRGNPPPAGGGGGGWHGAPPPAQARPAPAAGFAGRPMGAPPHAGPPPHTSPPPPAAHPAPAHGGGGWRGKR